MSSPSLSFVLSELKADFLPLVVSFFVSSFAMAASGFMNSNSLPIALVQSLVVEVPGLKWGKDGQSSS